MTIVAREPLAKSEVEIAIANVATMLVSASRMISGEVVPNFEAIVEQNELSFAQKRKDVSTVQALLTSENAAVPMLQNAAEIIRGLHALSEAISLDTVATIHLPAKPLPEGSLLRDTLRRLHYVQKVVEAVSKWLNDFGEHDDLKESVLYTKTQQELIRTFKCVVIQVQQATIIIGKYRDMGDIRVLREMTLDTQTVLSELKEADKSIAKKRKSISLFKRVVEESKSAPKFVRQLVSVTAGFAVVVVLSVAVIKLNTLAPQVFQPTYEDVVPPPVEQETQMSIHSNRKQEPLSSPEIPVKSQTDVLPKEIASPVKREDITPTIPTLAPQNTRATKPESKQTNLKVRQDGESTPVLKKQTNKPPVNRADKLVKQKSASPKVTEETETVHQKNSERMMPKRKTIVIED